MERKIEGPENDYPSAAEVADWLGVSLSTFERMVTRGEFPDGILMSQSIKVWHWLDAIAWMHLRFRSPSGNVNEAQGTSKRLRRRQREENS